MFPAGRIVAYVTITAAVVGVVALSLTALTADSSTTRPAVLFSVMATWVVAILAVLPVATLARRGVRATLIASLLGMAVRMMLCLGVALLGIYILDMPATVLLLTMVGGYVVMLFVEVAFVARYLWFQDSPVGSPAHRPCR